MSGPVHQHRGKFRSTSGSFPLYPQQMKGKDLENAVLGFREICVKFRLALALAYWDYLHRGVTNLGEKAIDY